VLKPSLHIKVSESRSHKRKSAFVYRVGNSKLQQLLSYHDQSVSDWVCSVHFNGSFCRQIFPANQLHCTSTDNQKQNTSYTLNTNKKQEKSTLANRTIYSLIWYGQQTEQTAQKPTRGNIMTSNLCNDRNNTYLYIYHRGHSINLFNSHGTYHRMSPLLRVPPKPVNVIKTSDKKQIK